MQSLHSLTTAKEIAPGGHPTYTPKSTHVGGVQLHHRSANIEEHKQDPAPGFTASNTSPSYSRSTTPFSDNIHHHIISHYSVFATHSLYFHSSVWSQDPSSRIPIPSKSTLSSNRSADRKRSPILPSSNLVNSYLSPHHYFVSSRTLCFSCIPDLKQDPKIDSVQSITSVPGAPTSVKIQQHARKSRCVDHVPKFRVHLRNRTSAPTEQLTSPEEDITTNTRSNSKDLSPRSPATT